MLLGVGVSLYIKEIMTTTVPSPHSFCNLPLEASFFKFTLSKSSISVFFANLRKNILKYIFFILPCMVVFKALYLCYIHDVWSFVYFIQQSISHVPFFGQTLSEYIWGNNLLLSLDTIKKNQNIVELIFVGGLGGSVGKSLMETWFSDYFKLPGAAPAVAGPANIGGDFSSGKVPSVKIPLILQSTQDSELNKNLGSASSNVPAEEGRVNVPSSGTADETSSTVPKELWCYHRDNFYGNVVPVLEQYTSVLKKISDKAKYFTWEIPENNTDPTINIGSVAEGFFTAVKYQADILIRASTGRDEFIRDFRFYLSPEDKAKIEEISSRLDDAKEEYILKMETLEGTGPSLKKLRVEIKLFFDYTNSYRNTVKRELNEAESILKRGLKKHPSFKDKEFRKMINVDYPKVVKSLNDQDNYLKRRIAEILNEKGPKG